jgi:predicted phage gp36 major capsid-like protein
MEMKQELRRITADAEAVKTDLRLKNAEMQRDIAQMKLQMDQMRRQQTQRAAPASKSRLNGIRNVSDC